MSELRVLHVSEVHWGGVVSLLREFTAEQVGRGMEVHVLAPDFGPVADGVTFHDWSLVRAKPWTLPGAVRQLRALVDELKPDVIHLHSFMAGFVGRLPGALPSGVDAAVVYQPHAWSFELYADRLRPRLVAAAERRAVRRTDLLVANCQDEIDQGASSGIVLPAKPLGVAVDAGHFHPVSEAERKRLRVEHELGDDRILVCVGRLAWQKGQDLLVAEWEKAPIPSTTLVLVGPGDQDALAAAAPNEWARSITWAGEQSDVRPWMWAADVLVLPSRYETVAIVVAEAMSCGVPVVATAVNGTRETLLDPPGEPSGSVVPLGDMSGLLREAERRLDDAELASRDAVVGRERAEDRFRPALVGQRLESAYREAIEHRRRGKRS
jgi:glycosyltransferase involved in cell wall biosynthesis